MLLVLFSKDPLVSYYKRKRNYYYYYRVESRVFSPQYGTPKRRVGRNGAGYRYRIPHPQALLPPQLTSVVAARPAITACHRLDGRQPPALCLCPPSVRPARRCADRGPCVHATQEQLSSWPSFRSGATQPPLPGLHPPRARLPGFCECACRLRVACRWLYTC